MSGYGLSPLACADLEGIFDYIAKDSPASAVRVVDKITEAFERIADAPLSFPLAPESAPPMRRAIEGNYKIFYRPHEDGVRIERVLHGARLVPDDM